MRAVNSHFMAMRVALLLVLQAALGACTGPARSAADYARAHGFQEDVTSGSTFRHRVYRAHTASGSDAALHVYIEGDGSPFVRATVAALDPTPRHPLMLYLMALDPAPSLYLGRPCYFGLQADGACTARFWTLERFAPEVLDSLASAMLAEAVRSHASTIELYAHSGGGTLAVLLAARVAMVTRVVTIGANLDTDAWCALHGYTPLTGSLNPARLKAVPEQVEMLHLVGSEDRNTPPSLIENAVQTGVAGTVRVIPGYTHACCWQDIWPGVLSERDRAARRETLTNRR